MALVALVVPVERAALELPPISMAELVGRQMPRPMLAAAAAAARLALQASVKLVAAL